MSDISLLIQKNDIVCFAQRSITGRSDDFKKLSHPWRRNS